MHKGLWWLWLSSLVIVLDQTSKYIISHTLTLYQTVKVFPFFNLMLLHNRGAAFSFLDQTGNVALWLFAGIATAVSVAIIIWLYRLPRGQVWQGCALALILGGALGNLLDRLTRGHVVDFIHFKFWPVFNMADSCIFVGVVLMAFFLLRQGEKGPEEGREAPMAEGHEKESSEQNLSATSWNSNGVKGC